MALIKANTPPPLSDGDNQGETSSSSGSSGIVVNANGTSSLFHPHLHNAYLHLTKEDEIIGNVDLNGTPSVQNGKFSVPITKDTPSFVSWNWSLIRKCTFLLFLAGLIGMMAMVVAMIVHLPRHCNPKVEWYRGGVIYEVFPASFQDSNGDGVGDLKGISQRVDYLEELGVSAIRLNSIFPAQHYPDHFEQITDLKRIAPPLGTEVDLANLKNKLHSRNMSLILDLPLLPLIKKLDPVYDASYKNQTVRWSCDETNCIQRHEDTLNTKNEILDTMRFWLAKGIDGFYVKFLENFNDDPYLIPNIRLWKAALGADRILMVSSQVFEQLDGDDAKELAQQVDLVDVFVDIKNGSQYMADQVRTILTSPVLGPGVGPWIQWSLGGVTERRLSQEMSSNASLAASIAQFMLPGTVNLFYGDEIALQASGNTLSADNQDTKHLHHLAPMLWRSGEQFTKPTTLPWISPATGASFSHFEVIQKMIELRKNSPTIYLNAAAKDKAPVLTTYIRYNKRDVFILERWFPRRNSFVSISNFGKEKLTLDLSAMFYSGTVTIGHGADAEGPSEKILFRDFHIGPYETIIAKLDK